MSRRASRAVRPLVLVAVLALLPLAVPAATEPAGAVEPLGTLELVGRVVHDPYALAVGGDGNVWFRHQSDTIGRITPAGAVTVLPAPGAAGFGGIAGGPDGNLWYTSGPDHLVVKLTPAGVATTYADALASAPESIVAGPDGNLWFTDAATSSIGTITTAGVITHHTDPAIVDPRGITSDGTGALWYRDGAGIGRITTDGVVTAFATSAGVADLVVGPDGNVWYTTEGSLIGRVTPAGVETTFPAGVHESSDEGAITRSIAVGPDGALWVTNARTFWWFDGWKPFLNAGWVTRYDTGGNVLSMTTNGLDNPGDIITGPDGNVWFVDQPYAWSFYNHYVAGFVTRMTPAGSAATFSGPLYLPLELAPDPRGGMWLIDGRSSSGGTSRHFGGLSHLDGDGSVTYPGVFGYVLDQSTGPDGSLWYSATDLYGSSSRGRVAPDGTVSDWPDPTQGELPTPVIAATPDGNAVYATWDGLSQLFRDGSNRPYAILPSRFGTASMVAAPDGTIWLLGEGHQLARVDPDGTVSVLPAPTDVVDLVIGADGAPWITTASGHLGRLAPDGAATWHDDPALDDPRGLIAGPDGYLWAVDGTTGAVARISLAGTAEVVATPADRPTSLAAGSDGQVWIAEPSRIETLGTGLAAPAPATDVEASAAIDRATVTWSAAGAPEAVLGATYTVTASPGGQQCLRTSGALSCAITGLDIGTSYTFTVTAANAAGTAETSPPSTPVTTAIHDLPPGAPFRDDAAWLVNEGIASGYIDGTFRPTAPVTRQAMAAFLYRRAGSPQGAHPTCAQAPFTDVPPTAPFCGEIAWLASTGVTTGFADGTFHPAATVSRRAMAAFLYRTAGSPEGPSPACAAPPFTDVPRGAPFCGEIAWLTANLIATGYADGTYRPGTAVSRGAMAAFLHRLSEVPTT